jgi:hypothetical protein
MMSAFSQRGGARLGLFNASWPFATLSASHDELRLSCLGSDYVFYRSNTRRLRRHRGLFSVGLRIEHLVPTYPDFIVFWVFDFKRLKARLESLGYEIEG